MYIHNIDETFQALKDFASYYKREFIWNTSEWGFFD